MNTRILTTLAAAAVLGSAPRASAGAPVDVYGVATVSESTVILDVLADTNGLSLRGFGIKVQYDPSSLTFDSGGRYDGLWFLRGENAVVYPYTDITQPERDCVRVVGGRLDGSNPGAGVQGDRVLLATLVFKPLNADKPIFGLGFASPMPYVNFAAAGGDPLDDGVRFAEDVPVQNAPEDRDNDGLPDDFEMAAFGDVETSDGTGDTDGDGDTDTDEWLRGTDPADPQSRFDLQVVPQRDGSKLVIWTGELGRVYDLEWSEGLASFELIAAGLPGLAPVLELLDELHNKHPEGFYRVKAKFPTAGR